MNHIELTPNQIQSIQRQFPTFDELTLLFTGFLALYDDSVGDERALNVRISFLEVRVLGRWFTLIDRETELDDGLIELTNEQYHEIKESLLRRQYD
jgi:hypothetical protein